MPSTVDEDSLTVADPFETAKALALAKAEEVAGYRPDALVIGSDTVVALDGGDRRQLAKPQGRADAVAMLRKLSGRCHSVITGVAIVAPGWKRVDADATTVCFRVLSDDEIEAYVDSGEPMDKAGGYAIQGGAAGFVEQTDGSISNVIGLPIELLAKMLNEFRETGSAD